MTFSFPRGKTRARRKCPSHFFHYKTLAPHQLQSGSVVCGSDLKVKKALLPDVPFQPAFILYKVHLHPHQI